MIDENIFTCYRCGCEQEYEGMCDFCLDVAAGYTDEE